MLMQVVTENAGASKCALILLKNNQLMIKAISVLGKEINTFGRSIPVEDSVEIPVTSINYVYRTQVFMNLLANAIEGRDWDYHCPSNCSGKA